MRFYSELSTHCNGTLKQFTCIEVTSFCLKNTPNLMLDFLKESEGVPSSQPDPGACILSPGLISRSRFHGVPGV